MYATERIRAESREGFPARLPARTAAMLFLGLCLLVPRGRVSGGGGSLEDGPPTDSGARATESSERAESAERGLHFRKKTPDSAPLPRFEDMKTQLPVPIYDEDPAYVACYWKAWELAFRNFHAPVAGSGFVSSFIDAAFNQNIFLWDTAFMTMFMNYGHPYVPGIRSLDNFYARQHPDGEICREIDRKTGLDFAPWTNAEGEPLFSRWGYDWEMGPRKVPVSYRGREAPDAPPRLTLDALNHPILAWAEVESYRVTGDRARIGAVWEPLLRYYRALQLYLRQGNGLYLTDAASMDNSPRNRWLEGGGTAVDTSSEMVLFARNLAEMGRILGKDAEARKLEAEAGDLARIINERMWDPEARFYFDLTLEGKRVPVKTVAGFWPLVAGVASAEQAAALARELEDPRTFATTHPVPTLAADQEGFQAETGGYWRGSVWAPTNTMVIRGLKRYGRQDLASAIARKHLDCVVRVFEATGTIWENYSPTKVAPGRPAKRDFVGWSGLAPIAYLLEFAIGLEADAPAGRLLWRIESPRRVGVERFWFGGRTASLLCEEAGPGGKRRVRVESDGPFVLRIVCGSVERELEITAGTPVELDL